MPDELPPPVVTISDPAHPAPPSDVIGGGTEREPRRLSRRSKVIALAVLLVVAVITVPVVVVVDRREQARLDRLAGEQVDLGTPEESDVFFSSEIYPDATEQFVPLTLENHGPDDVEVLTARIDREGYPTQDTLIHIGNGDTGQLNVTLPEPCPQQVSQFSTPRRIILTVRTTRGTVVERAVRVDGIFGGTYQRALRIKCGVLSPSEALDTTVSLLSEEPRRLRLDLLIDNQALSSFALEQVRSLGGFTVVSDEVPLGLLAETPTHVPVWVEVDECSAAQALVRHEMEDSALEPFLVLRTDQGSVAVYDLFSVLDPLTRLVDRVC